VDLDFPVDLRDRCHRIILKHGVHTLPVNAPEKDFETVYDHVYLLTKLSFDLHTFFHDIARDERTPYWDNPRAPLMALLTRGEERQEAMVAAELARERGE